MKPTLNAKNIIKKIEEKKQSIKKFGVKKIGLFGSFAKKKQHKKSDVDILVTFENPTFDAYMDLKFMLERLFGRKVDLTIEKDLRPEFKNIKEETKYVKI